MLYYYLNCVVTSHTYCVVLDPTTSRTLTTMSQFPDYYKLLNISKSATQEEVRQAYRKESLRLVSCSLFWVFYIYNS